MRRFIVLYLLSTNAFAGVCNYQVANRGKIPQWFIEELTSWAKGADQSIFVVNANYDVYNLMAPKLGPYKNHKHRVASLINGLLVHAGMESSWDHTEGIDTSKPTSLNTCMAAEAGAYQPSYDSVNNFGGDLPPLFDRSCSKYSGSKCMKFQKCAKYNHDFSHEYTARLLRHRNGWKHFGPWLRGENQKYLSRACVAQIEATL
jgi:hypothetical protein